MRHRAAEISPATTAIEGLLAVNALFRLRTAQEVLGLAERHEEARLDAACAKATAAGDPSYRTITQASWSPAPIPPPHSGACP